MSTREATPGTEVRQGGGGTVYRAIAYDSEGQRKVSKTFDCWPRRSSGATKPSALVV